MQKTLRQQLEKKGKLQQFNSISNQHDREYFPLQPHVAFT
jgi:hypothetical protein